MLSLKSLGTALLLLLGAAAAKTTTTLRYEDDSGRGGLAYAGAWGLGSKAANYLLWSGGSVRGHVPCGS